MSITAGDVLESERKPGGPRPVISGRMDALSDEQCMILLDGPEVEAAFAQLYDRCGRTVFGVGLKPPSASSRLRRKPPGSMGTGAWPKSVSSLRITSR
jgi:hypothetical protein